MSNSKIIYYVSLFVRKTRYFYSNSTLSKTVAKINKYILQIFQTSLVYKFIIKDWDKNENIFINRIYKGLQNKEIIKSECINGFINNSRTVSLFSKRLNNLFHTNVRYIGIIIVIYSLIALIKGNDYLYGSYFFVLNICLLLLGILLIIISKPIYNLIKGSIILKLISELFVVEE